jgi:hypothetical protein
MLNRRENEMPLNANNGSLHMERFVDHDESPMGAFANISGVRQSSRR